MCLCQTLKPRTCLTFIFDLFNHSHVSDSQIPFSQLLVSDRCSCEIVFRLQPTFLSLETTLNVKHFQECQALIKTFKLEKTDRDQEKHGCTNRSPLPNTGHRTAASSGLDFLLHIHRRSRPLLTLTA